MPKVLSKELRESTALVLLEFARSKYPEYTDAQLSSAFKKASSKVKKVRSKLVEAETVQPSI